DTVLGGGWKTGQWNNFACTRVRGNGGGTQPAGLKISAVGGGDINLNSLKGQGSVQLSPAGVGSSIFRLGNNAPQCIGIITIPGTPDRYIIFQHIQGDTLTHCYSPSTGPVTANTAVETGDFWFGLITGSGPNTLNLSQAPNDGVKKLTRFVSGDKYVIARVLAETDSAGRGQSDEMGETPDIFAVNVQRGTGGVPGAVAALSHNVMDPIYVFNNIRPASAAPNNKTQVSARINVIADRDWFDDNSANSTDYNNYHWGTTPGSPGPNFTAGVAIGLDSEKPSGSNYA